MLIEHGAQVVTAFRRPGAAVAGARSASADLATPGAATGLVRAHQPSLTLNLAGYGVDPTERDPELTQRLNADLPRELAMACATCQDPSWPGVHLVHAGSALEYGTAAGDLSEDTLPTPTTRYGQSKLAGTQALVEAGTRGGLRALSARLFMVYGPGEPAHRLLPSLREAAATNTPLPLTAGEQQRDFTYVDDAVEGMLRLGAVDCGTARVINVATGVLTPVAGFVRAAAAVLAIAPERLRFGVLPTRPAEMAHDPVSIAALERLTGWRPATSILDGIRRTVDEAGSAPR